MAGQKSLEVRINSVSDAKATVQNSARISKICEEVGLDSIELLIAEEVKDQVMPFLAGIFKQKSYQKIISVQPGNTFYSLPHFQEPAPTASAKVPPAKKPAEQGA